jgi:soluble P-type ATPase
MIEVDIPGFGLLRLRYLVLDYNGTLACDGILLQGVPERLRTLAAKLQVHVVTADTFGTVNEALGRLPAKVAILPRADQDAAKEQYVRQLGARSTVAIGNGRNDRRMLREAALGIAVTLEEGAAVSALTAADVACVDVTAALDLLAEPQRLIATLRS